MPLVEGLKSGGWCRDCTHAARRLARFSGPGHYCSANHPKWSGWQELHLRPPRSEQGRLLLTLHPEKWLPDLDSHQDKRLNRPPCYFDTTWQWCCRQDLHLRSLRPKPSALAATLRAENSGRLILETSERRNTPPKTLAVGSAVRFEIGGYEGTCTLSLPADNGLLL